MPPDFDYYEKKKKWYRFAQSLVFDCLDKFQKSSKLHLYYSFLQLGKLKNIHQAWYEIMRCAQQKPSVEEEFSNFMYRKVIETMMQEEAT